MLIFPRQEMKFSPSYDEILDSVDHDILAIVFERLRKRNPLILIRKNRLRSLGMLPRRFDHLEDPTLKTCLQNKIIKNQTIKNDILSNYFITTIIRSIQHCDMYSIYIRYLIVENKWKESILLSDIIKSITIYNVNKSQIDSFYRNWQVTHDTYKTNEQVSL